MIVDLRLGDCREILPQIESASVDAAIMDPPYPEISRDYGRLTEAEWWDLMMVVCKETRRILKPSGSAVFILQPNSRKVGSMRGWLFEFQAWVCREWNMIQDAWWWNFNAMPTGLCTPRERGLLRASVKACVWCGPSDAYRDQSQVLWAAAESAIATRNSARLRGKTGRHNSPSGNGKDHTTIMDAADERGGVTPFNLLPIANNSSAHKNSSGSNGHGAGTPIDLADWWIRYICPPAGTILDPFLGAGTMGIAAIEQGKGIVGIEQMEKHYHSACQGIANACALAQPRLI